MIAIRGLGCCTALFPGYASWRTYKMPGNAFSESYAHKCALQKPLCTNGISASRGNVTSKLHSEALLSRLCHLPPSSGLNIPGKASRVKGRYSYDFPNSFFDPPPPSLSGIYVLKIRRLGDEGMSVWPRKWPGTAAFSARVCDDQTSDALLSHYRQRRQSCYIFLLLPFLRQ